MTLKIAHIHGFKCAGTTFSASLAANFENRFRMIEPKHSQELQWESVLLLADTLGLEAMSSHSLAVPASIPKNLQFVHLVREPSARLISAWKYEVITQKQFEGPFSRYLNARGFSKNHQSNFLLNSGVAHNFDSVESSYAYFNYFPHRPELFLGVVERYDESMTILELLLSQRSVKIDLSYPVALNQKESIFQDLIPDVGVPPNFVNLDQVLYELANIRLDLHISRFPNFKTSLIDFRTRCKLHRESEAQLLSRIQNEHWMFTD